MNQTVFTERTTRSVVPLIATFCYLTYAVRRHGCQVELHLMNEWTTNAVECLQV